MRRTSFVLGPSLLAAAFCSQPILAANVLVWTGGQGHTGITNTVTRLQALGHTVTVSATVPADLTPFDSLWALDYLYGPNDADERTMVAAFLSSDRGVYAQFEWDCCTASQVNWTATLAPLLTQPFLIQGSQGASADAIAEPGEVFGLTTTPNAIPLLRISATANIATIPAANVVYRLNGIPVVGAYVDPQFVSGDGCVVLSGDIEQLFSAPQAPVWIENAQYFLDNCIPNPPQLCGDGFLAAGEECDDGDTSSGDGCSDTCTVETGWSCTNDTGNTPVSACEWTCSSEGQPCSVGVGACLGLGTIVCTGPSQETCDAVPGQPSAETCDGLDNNCDGSVDEGNPGSGAVCSSGLPGVCSSGVTDCQGGWLACVPGVQPGANAETCDGLDNDCDGATDEVCAAVSATKVAAGAFTVGSTVTYTIIVANAGPGPQADNSGPEVTDILPATLALVSASAASGTALATPSTNTVTWDGSIAAGASVTIAINATILASAGGTTVTNQGVIAFDSDGNSTNESRGLTDDPALGGLSDATQFAAAQIEQIPALSLNGLVALLVLLSALGIAVLRRR